MRVSYIAGREATCDLMVCSGSLKPEHYLHGVHRWAIPCHLSQRTSSSASFLSSHKCKENTTSKMHKESERASALHHPLSRKMATLTTYLLRERSTCVKSSQLVQMWKQRKTRYVPLFS